MCPRPLLNKSMSVTSLDTLTKKLSSEMVVRLLLEMFKFS